MIFQQYLLGFLQKFSLESSKFSTILRWHFYWISSNRPLKLLCSFYKNISVTFSDISFENSSKIASHNPQRFNFWISPDDHFEIFFQNSSENSSQFFSFDSSRRSFWDNIKFFFLAFLFQQLDTPLFQKCLLWFLQKLPHWFFEVLSRISS